MTAAEPSTLKVWPGADKPGPLSPLVKVTTKTPPTFLAVTHDDKLRGMNAALMYVELKRANVPAELHVFTTGGHGYGLRKSQNAVSQWPKHCEDWLRAQGLLGTAAIGVDRVKE